MHALRNLAGIGAGATMLIGLAAGTANAAVTPDHLSSACSFTVTHPATLYMAPNFDAGGTYIGGKHTGEGVTSAEPCSTWYGLGFHEVRMGIAGHAYMYASDLGDTTPTPAPVSRYTVSTSTADVFNAPTVKKGTILKRKLAGDVVTSPEPKGVGELNGFVEVLLSDGNIAWMQASHLK
jgi:hypothetical protein